MKTLFLLFSFLNVSFVMGQTDHNILRERLFKLRSDTRWEMKAQVPLLFDAFHTQGMVKIDEYFYMSSVEVFRWPKAYEQLQGKLDRDEGEGRGHIFKFDSNGNLLADLVIGEGAVYHPGGIDYDGRYIWVPVTEYRPHSFSIIYRVDPLTMTAEEIFRYDDSIGAIVHNTDNRTLVGVNWGARDSYHWTFDAQGHISNAGITPDSLAIKRNSYYVDFQDCKYIGEHWMLGSGLKSYKNESVNFILGGWELIDLRDNRPVHQIPIQLWSPSGRVMTNNPCTVETTDAGIRAYFVPDDDKKASLFIFETVTL